MEVRLMEYGDVDQVAAIEASSFSKPWSENLFREALELENYIYMVGVNNSEVLGYGGMYYVLEEANVTNIAVKESIRNMGIGYGILANLMDEVKKIGIKSVTLEVRESNMAAIHMYEQLGFVLSGKRKNFYEKPTEDAVIMWKHDL